jgi:hypothetical protein
MGRENPMVPDVHWMQFKATASNVGCSLAMVYKLVNENKVRVCLGPRPTSATRGRIEVYYLDYEEFVKVYKAYAERKHAKRLGRKLRLTPEFTKIVNSLKSLYERRLKRLQEENQKLKGKTLNGRIST